MFGAGQGFFLLSLQYFVTLFLTVGQPVSQAECPVGVSHFRSFQQVIRTLFGSSEKEPAENAGSVLLPIVVVMVQRKPLDVSA